jgi:hypothetical protein
MIISCELTGTVGSNSHPQPETGALAGFKSCVKCLEGFEGERIPDMNDRFSMSNVSSPMIKHRSFRS